MPHYPHRSEARERDRRLEQRIATRDHGPRVHLFDEQDSQDDKCDERYYRSFPSTSLRDKHDITGQRRHDRHEQAPEEKIEEKTEEANAGKPRGGCSRGDGPRDKRVISGNQEEWLPDIA